MTEFERYFAEVFTPELERVAQHTSGPVFSNGSGIAGARGDRCAAYLLFVGGKLPASQPWPECDRRRWRG